jgi:hypothetical protein
MNLYLCSSDARGATSRDMPRRFVGAFYRGSSPISRLNLIVPSPAFRAVMDWPVALRAGGLAAGDGMTTQTMHARSAGNRPAPAGARRATV